MSHGSYVTQVMTSCLNIMFNLLYRGGRVTNIVCAGNIVGVLGEVIVDRSEFRFHYFMILLFRLVVSRLVCCCSHIY